MKKILYLFLLVSSILTVSSCLTSMSDELAESYQESRITITFDTGSQRIPISAGESVDVYYTLSSGNDKTVVAVATDGKYTASVNKTTNTTGTITVTAPLSMEDGTVNVLVYSDNGYMNPYVLEFYEKTMEFDSGTQFSIGTDGGSVKIPYTANFKFIVSQSEGTGSWLEVTDEKSGETSGTITAKASKNTGGSRTGYIYITPEYGTGKPYATITINQASPYYVIDHSSFLFESAGGTGVSKIKTSRGLDIRIPEDKNWLSQTMSKSGDEYTVTFTAAANSSSSQREAQVGVYAADSPDVLLGNISVTQLASGSDPNKTMIIEVRANFANDFSVCLPILDCDCYISWGDEEAVEHVTTDRPLHKYDVTEGTTFDVKISGSVGRLSSNSIESKYLGCITSVKQWGNTGLLKMDYAFQGFYSLTTIPEDNSKAFSDVTSMNYAFAETSLTSIPSDLFRYAENVTGVLHLFDGCANLTDISEGLFDRMEKITSVSYIFYKCTSLKSVPADLFRNNSEVTDASYLFYSCSALTKIPATLFSSFSKVTSYSNCFYKCSTIQTIPEELFAASTLVTSFNNVFSNCTALTAIPAGLFAKNTAVENFGSAFNSCKLVESIPASLFDNNRKVSNFSSTFSSIRAKGESPYTMVGNKKVHLYERLSYPDHFVRPTSYSGCFSTGQYDDSAEIKAAGWN